MSKFKTTSDFIQYLYKKFGFFQDNPALYRGKDGKEWLEKNKKYALEGPDETLLIRGKETASLGSGPRYGQPSTNSVEDMFIPTKVLKSMKGANKERRIRGEPKFESLKKEIGDDFDIDQKGNKVVIGVNQNGEGFVLEGNTRTAVADKLNIPYLKTEVRYFNGGENAQGAFMPHDIIRMAKDKKGAQKSLKFEKEYGEYIKENIKNDRKEPYFHIGQLVNQFSQFNKGGTTMKNDPPVGSTPSEVADDIPAMISEGEFVIPADVVRYVGLDKIRAMMQEAKHGLACMEDEGLIVDVDEEGRPQEDQKEKSDDKVAIIETVQIEKVDPMMTQMAEGGMTDKDSPVSSPILNPENKPVMNQGGIFLSPDGSLNMAEGGMPMQMEGMMMEGASDPMMEEMPDEMAMPPEFADEMPPEEAEPMDDAPTITAQVAQEFNGQPHLLAYLNNEELGALQSAGRGLDENGKQILSPEGIPVFTEGETNDDADAAADESAGMGMSGPEGAGPDGAVGGGPHGGVSAPADPGDPNDVGDPGGSSQDENEPKLSKKIKEELDPEKDDKTYVSGVGFIDKYIENRLNNPLQGKPAYAVATVAQGGLMRTPSYVTMHQGGTPEVDNNTGNTFIPEIGFVPSEGSSDPMGSTDGMMSPPPTEGFYTQREGDNFLDIIGGLDLGNQEQMRDKFKESFKRYDDGSYDIEEGSELASAISNFRDASGELTTPQNAVYIEGDRSGQPISRQGKNYLTEGAIEALTNQYASS